MPAPVVAAGAAAAGSAGGAGAGAGAGVAGAGAGAGGAGASGAAAGQQAAGQAAAQQAASAGAKGAAGKTGGLKKALRAADYGSQAWEQRDQLLKLLLGVAGVLVLLIMLPLLAMMTIISMLSGASSDQTLTMTTPMGIAGGIPAVYAPMYEAAAGHYRVNPFALAALHSTESSYSENASAFTPNSAGAIGPMQFLPSTWRGGFADAYEPVKGSRPSDYPHKCEPHGCITDDFDAIAAAASYLHRLGAGPQLDQRTFKAFTYYKGRPPASEPYAREAYNLALSLQDANAGALPGGDAPTPDGPVLERVITMANWIDAQRYHYCFGGGHVQPARPSHGQWCVDENGRHVSGTRWNGLDCSGSVSMLLQHVGYRVTTRESGAYVGWGDSGKGRHLTIWANDGHVFLEIDGRFWGTSGGNWASGPGWGPQTTVGFTPSHPKGL
jgi:hypothetical protein